MILKKLLESIFKFFQYKVQKTTLRLLFFYVYISFKFLQTSLIIEELIKHENKGKSFTIEKILKIGFQNFHISWKASKGIFIGSLHNETVKYVFHEMLWKKYFTVCPRL